MMTRLICLVIGYLFGLIQTSYIIGKLHGIDIREYGSGNAGTTNAMRTLGKKAGMMTFVGDVLKCILAVLAVRLLFGSAHGDILPLLGIYASAGTILGHNFPVYMNFRGGKGIACSVGMALMLDWRLCVLGLLAFALILVTTHYVSLGSVICYIGLAVLAIAFGQQGVYGMAQPALNEMYAVIVLLTCLALFRHRANIARLLNGTENKMFLRKK